MYFADGGGGGWLQTLESIQAKFRVGEKKNKGRDR